MGGSSSKVSYSDNSAQVNQSLSNIRAQLNSLNKDINEFKGEIDLHINSVEKKFNLFDNKILLIHNEFTDSFNYLDYGIKMIGNDINQLGRLQIEYENSNSREHWEIFQNDWKENFERNIFQEYQQLKNLRFELEMGLNKKVVAYLLIKDKFNTQLNQYQNRKNQYEMRLIQNQMRLLLETNQSLLNNELNQFSKPEGFDEPNELELELEELVKLKKSISVLPLLDNEITDLFFSINRFEEISVMEKKLANKILVMKTNFSNPNLLNPLSNNIISPETLASKFVNSGFGTIKQICWDNQESLLVANGFTYIPEYKYNDLRKKFIAGCEKSDIKLNPKQEDIVWLAHYLYTKSSNKSLNSMVLFAKSPESIYSLNSVDSMDNIGEEEQVNWEDLILDLYNALDKNMNILELEYETDLMILYKILQQREFSNISELSNQMLGDMGFKPISDLLLSYIKYALALIDCDNKRNGKKIFADDIQIIKQELSQILEFNNPKYMDLVNQIVSQYIEKKKIGQISGFQFIVGDIQIIKEFFNTIIGWLLEKYFQTMLETFELTKMDVKNFALIVDKVISEDIGKNNIGIRKMFSFNKAEDNKIFVGFVFQQMYNYLWNKN